MTILHLLFLLALGFSRGLLVLLLLFPSHAQVHLAGDGCIDIQGFVGDNLVLNLLGGADIGLGLLRNGNRVAGGVAGAVVARVVALAGGIDGREKSPLGPPTSNRASLGMEAASLEQSPEPS